MMRKLGMRARNGRFAGAAGGLMLLACAVACCQAPKKRFEIVSTDVTAAIVGQGLPAEGLTVRLASSMTSSVANPELRVQSASMVTAHEARLRIACANGSECLPFLVTANWPGTVPAVTLPTQYKQAGAAAGSHVSPALRVGMPATLELEQGRIHIKLQVICLESGATGDKIRVTTKDRKQSYVAEIVNPTLLKGSL